VGVAALIFAARLYPVAEASRLERAGTHETAVSYA